MTISRPITHRIARMAATAAAGLAFAFPAFGQASGDHITLVVPFSPGGSTDMMARLLGERLGQQLKQPIVVKNQGGGGANIGANAVAKSPPDGKTLLMMTSTHAAGASLYKNLPYDIRKDLLPVARVAFFNIVLVTHKDVPAKSLKEFVAHAKQTKTPVSYSSSGIGAGQHLAGVLFSSMIKAEMLHVPYKGGGEAKSAVLGGQVNAYFAPMEEVISHIEDGTLRALGVTSLERSPRLPNVPAIAEVVPGYELNFWNGVMAPAGTPADQVERLNAGIRKAMDAPDLRKRLEDQGMKSAATTPAEFAKFLGEELPKWKQVVDISGVTAN